MVTNETETTTPTTPADGAAASLTRVLSGADLALCALLAGQVDLSGDAQLSLEQTQRQPVPQTLLATLLATAAAQLAGISSLTPLLTVQLRFVEQAYTDEPLRFTARRGEPDAAGALDVSVRMESEDGRALAEGVTRFQTR
jgi:hypothetical protein